MRTFSCFVTHERSETPVLSFILANDEVRARELARRELIETRAGVAVEICEGGRLVWSETIQVAPAA